MKYQESQVENLRNVNDVTRTWAVTAVAAVVSEPTMSFTQFLRRLTKSRGMFKLKVRLRLGFS